MKRAFLVLLSVLLVAGLLAGLYFVLPFGDGPDATRHRIITTSLVGALIALVLIGWWIRRLMASLKLKAGLSRDDGGEPESEEHAELARQFDRAVASLVARSGGAMRTSLALYRVPWFLLVGPPNAGKSTALRVSGLRFPRSQAVQGVGGTRNCDWWFSPDAVFLDTAGRYAREFEDEPEWLAFLDLLYQHRKRRPIDGVLVTVGLDEILPLGPAELDELADTLRERVGEAYSRLRSRVPILILITKVDLLEGFDVALSSLDPRERERPWGFPFRADTADPDAFLDRIESHFEALVGRVETFVLSRSLAVSSPGELEQVMAFLRHLKAASRSLTRFASRLAEPLDLEMSPLLAGVYLLCGKVGDQGALPMRDPVEERFGVPWQGRFEGAPPERPEGSWFVRDLFGKVVVQRLAALYHRRARVATVKRWRVAVLALSFLSVALLSGLMGTTYQRTRVRLDRTRQAYLGLLYGARDRGGGELAPLEQLDRFRRQLDRLTAARVRPGNYSVMLAQLERVYAERLKEVILDPVADRIARQLVLAASWTPDQDSRDFRLFERYYQTLETGLALSGGGCYRGDFGLGSRIEQEWKRATRAGDVSRFGAIFSDVAERVGQSNALPWIDLDDGLVARARSGLARADLAVRAYQKVVSALSLPPPPAIALEVTRVPRVDPLYLEPSCRAFRKALSDVRFEGDRDCVLNMDLPNQARDPDALWDQYQRRYLRWWKDWLNHWSLRQSLESLADVESVLSNFTTARTSDLVAVFREIGGVAPHGISLPGGLDVSLPSRVDPCQKLTAAFAPYPAAVAPDQEAPSPTAEALSNLHSSLHALRLKLAELNEDPSAVEPVLSLLESTVAGDSELTRALDAARRFEQSVTDGDPLAAQRVRAMVQDVVQATWTLVRGRVQRVLDTRWRSEVWSAWRNLASRYPLSPGAHSVASCPELEAVLGNGDSSLTRFLDSELGRFLVDSRAMQIEARRGRLGPALRLSDAFVSAVAEVRRTFSTAQCVSDPPSDIRPELASGSRSSRVSAVRFESAGTCWSFRMSSRAATECPAFGDGVALGVVVGSGPRATFETLYRFDGPWAFERLLEAADTELRNRRSFCWKATAGATGGRWDATIWLEFPGKLFERRMSVDQLRRIALPEHMFQEGSRGPSR